MTYYLKGIVYNKNNRDSVMLSSQTDIDHLFTLLQQFIEHTHKEIWDEYQLYDNSKPDYLKKQINYFDEELYRFLSLIPAYYPTDVRDRISNWQFFEEHLKELADISSEISIKRLWAIKYFHNKLERENFEKDSAYIPQFYDNMLLPLGVSSESKFDIIMMHGNQSHWLRSWSIEDEKQHSLVPRVWVKDYLYDDLKELNPRIMFWTYETFQTKSDYINKNIPELTIQQLSEKVKESFHKAGVGKGKPVLFICYSMSGIIAKLIINNDQDISSHTKAIVYFSTPHFGSNVKEDTAYQLQDYISGMNSFISHHSISDEEFVSNFFDGIKISEIARYLDFSEERKIYLKALNDEYMQHKINNLWIVEGKKAYFERTQHYFYVDHASAYIPGSKKVILEERDHFNISKMKDKNEKSYQEIIKFIRENIK